MHELMQDEWSQYDERCTPGVDCGTWLAVPYFLSFTVIAALVFLNIAVAVILDNMSSDAVPDVDDDIARAHERE